MADLSRIATTGEISGAAVHDQIMSRSFGILPAAGLKAKSFDSLQGGWVSALVQEDVASTSVLDITLRPWSLSDASDYQRLLSDPGLWTYLPETFHGPLDAEAAADLLRVAMQDGVNITRAIIWLGQPVGQVRLTSAYTGQPELSYWIGKPFRGNGLARKAVQSFLTDMQDVTSGVFARVHKDNTASQRVLAALGFERDPGAGCDSFLHFRRHG